MTDKEIRLAKRIQEMEAQLSRLQKNILADVEAIELYINRDNPNIDAVNGRLAGIRKEFNNVG